VTSACQIANRRASILVIACFLSACGCSSPRVVAQPNPDLDPIVLAAQKAFADGSVEQAARQYARAVARARAADNAAEIESNAYNLGACLLLLGHADEARALLREAHAEARRIGHDPTAILLLEAKAAYFEGQVDEAVNLADQLSNSSTGKNNATYQLEALLIKLQVRCDHEQPEKQDLEKARTLALGVSDPTLKAGLENLLGRIAQMDGDEPRAATTFDREAELLQQGGNFREMAHALVRAGDAFALAGQQGEAADRLYRAARSLFAQGDTIGALKQIEPALHAAKLADDDSLLQRVGALFREIQRSVSPDK